MFVENIAYFPNTLCIGMCWVIPTVTGIIVHSVRKTKRMNGSKGFWLQLLLMGGAIFGIIDHIWNGELLLLGAQPMKDIALGVVITVGIFVIWGIITASDKKKGEKHLATR